MRWSPSCESHPWFQNRSTNIRDTSWHNIIVKMNQTITLKWIHIISHRPMAPFEDIRLHSNSVVTVKINAPIELALSFDKCQCLVIFHMIQKLAVNDPRDSSEAQRGIWLRGRKGLWAEHAPSATLLSTVSSSPLNLSHCVQCCYWIHCSKIHGQADHPWAFRKFII